MTYHQTVHRTSCCNGFINYSYQMEQNILPII